MPKGEKYSAQYYIDNILTPICQRSIPAGKRKSAIRADISRCHIATVPLDFVLQRKVRLAPYPPYSTDIAPPDIFLFGYSKRELRDSGFQTAEDYLVEVPRLVGETSPEALLDVFRDWIA
jgi:hypothetical protein